VKNPYCVTRVAISSASSCVHFLSTPFPIPRRDPLQHIIFGYESIVKRHIHVNQILAHPLSRATGPQTISQFVIASFGFLSSFGIPEFRGKRLGMVFFIPEIRDHGSREGTFQHGASNLWGTWEVRSVVKNSIPRLISALFASLRLTPVPNQKSKIKIRK